MMLHLIRHALTKIDRSVPSQEWGLDPAGDAALEELERSRDWTRVPYWYSSTEPKAVATARALTDHPVNALDDLRELERGWDDDYEASVVRMFADTRVPAGPGWETGDAALRRFDAGMRACAGAADGEDVAVVAHGLVISLWRAMLRRSPVSLDEWRALRFPDLLILGDDGVAAWLANDDTPIELRRR